MFDGVFGVRLTLWIGQGIARPASAGVMEALVSAEVAISDTERSGFEMGHAQPADSTVALTCG